jgi:hypothetical protein
MKFQVGDLVLSKNTGEPLTVVSINEFNLSILCNGADGEAAHFANTLQLVKSKDESLDDALAENVKLISDSLLAATSISKTVEDDWKLYVSNLGNAFTRAREHHGNAYEALRRAQAVLKLLEQDSSFNGFEKRGSKLISDARSTCSSAQLEVNAANELQERLKKQYDYIRQNHFPKF